MWFANVYATCGNGVTDLTVVVDDYISLFIHLSMQIGACWAILFQRLGMGENVPVVAGNNVMQFNDQALCVGARMPQIFLR